MHDDHEDTLLHPIPGRPTHGDLTADRAGEVESSVIGLVACSAQKLDHAAPARELYCSPLFRRSLAYAEPRCARVYVLSARHHLVALDAVLEPYEQRLSSIKRERRRWACVVAAAIEARHGHDVQLLLLAGREYTAPLIQEVAHWWPIGAWRERVRLPLERMQVGERLRWLNDQLARSAA
jgi:hypothetical protein